VKENIEAGVTYLRYLLDMFGDDRLAVAAYNAGESAVLRYGNVPPYRETMNYVSRVGKALGTARQQAPAPPAAAEAPPPPEEAGARAVEAYVDSQGRICMRTR
jgi:soluble lytic murein transglycosylase-like protein